MKNNNFLLEVLLSVLLIIAVALFFEPLQALWMPTMFMAMVIIAFIIIFVFFAIFIWKEKPRDEREEQHRLIAGRVGFLVGAGLLVAGIIIQSLRHTLDSWLLVALVGMIVGKLAARLYSQTKF